LSEAAQTYTAMDEMEDFFRQEYHSCTKARYAGELALGGTTAPENDELRGTLWLRGWRDARLGRNRQVPEDAPGEWNYTIPPSDCYNAGYFVGKAELYWEFKHKFSAQDFRDLADIKEREERLAAETEERRRKELEEEGDPPF
jgi:hypothetical protein